MKLETQDIRNGQDFDKNYKEFFKDLVGFYPYPYQVDFASRDKTYIGLSAPTGMGKTYAALVSWLYDSIHAPKATPRRLIFQLPLRTLVKQTLDTINKLVAKSGIDVDVHCMLGGEVDDSFVEEPERRKIIVTTLDQLVSRQLNRPYTASVKSALIHFISTNDDVRIILDESQLQPQAFPTSTELHSLMLKQPSFFKRELVLCSATLDLTSVREGIEIVSLTEADYAHKAARKKIGQYKSLTLKPQMSDDEFIRLVEDQHISGTLTLVIVNTVKRAQSIYSRLQTKKKRLLHSKFRKADRAVMETGLDKFKGILVSTQVVEAGIDLDARKLITDVCPWSSFVQRCGRLGRNATYKQADCIVVDIPNYLPYKKQHIQDTVNRLFKIADVSIHTLMNVTPPPEFTKRPIIDLPLLKKLFDVHNKEPISELVRDIGNPSVYLCWRLGRKLHSTMDKPDQLELCSVMPNEFIKMEVKEAWIVDEEKSTRKQTVYSKVDWKTHKVEPGNTYIIPTASKNYSKELGFLLGCRRRVVEINQKTPRTRRAGGSYANAKNKAFGLVGHSCDAANFARGITRQIDLVFDEYKEAVILSAYLHDTGKAHPVFQETCYGTDPNNPLAKGDAYKRFPNGQAYSRPGFRHEAVSALQAMEWELDPIIVWLLGTHHGQIITQFKSYREGIDTETSCAGIYSGDVVPAVRGAWRRDIPRPSGIPVERGYCFPETPLRLPWEHERKWEQMFDELWEEFGPLVLAALHSYVRIADHRASEFRSPDFENEDEI